VLVVNTFSSRNQLLLPRCSLSTFGVGVFGRRSGIRSVATSTNRHLVQTVYVAG